MSNNFIIEALNLAYSNAPQFTGGHFILLEEWDYPSSFTKAIKQLNYTLWYKENKKLYQVFKLDLTSNPKNEKDEDNLKYKLLIDVSKKIFEIISNDFLMIKDLTNGTK